MSIRRRSIAAWKPPSPYDSTPFCSCARSKSDEVVTVLQDAGFNLVYLPRSSPDLSPIEPCWSKVKTLLRRHAPRPLENLEQDLPPILDAVT
jgi:hypothetical protein